MGSLIGTRPNQVPSNGDLGNMAFEDIKHYGRRVDVPSSASSVGATGDYAYNASYFYICIDIDTWQRVVTATW